MKRTIASICLCFTLTCVTAAASTREDLQARIDAAKTVLNEIMAAHDATIPLNILKQATCVGVVPGMKKGAFLRARSMARAWLPAAPATAGARRSLYAWQAARSASNSAGNRRI